MAKFGDLQKSRLETIVVEKTARDRMSEEKSDIRERAMYLSGKEETG